MPLAKKYTLLRKKTCSEKVKEKVNKNVKEKVNEAGNEKGKGKVNEEGNEKGNVTVNETVDEKGNEKGIPPEKVFSHSIYCPHKRNQSQ